MDYAAAGFDQNGCFFVQHTMSVLRLSLKATGEWWVKENCWKMADSMKALAWTHLACSTVTFRPLLLMKQVAVCNAIDTCCSIIAYVVYNT